MNVRVLVKSLASSLGIAALMAAYIFVSETLHLVRRSAYFVADIGTSILETAGWYAAYVVVAGVIVGLAARQTRHQALMLAAIAYIAVAWKVLWLDAALLHSRALALAFVVFSVALGAATSWLARKLDEPVSVPVLVTAAFINAVLGVASGWSLAGGRLMPFLASGRTVLTVVTVMLTLVLTLVALRKLSRFSWSRQVVHCTVLLALCGMTLVSSRMIERHTVRVAAAADAPDIYILSFDALRHDVLQDFIRREPTSNLARLAAAAAGFDNVVAHGSSTDAILANNTFAGTTQTSCRDSLPSVMERRGYFTAMLYAGTGRRFEGSVCYEYYFAGDGQDLVWRYSLPAMLRTAVNRKESIRHKTQSASVLVEKLSSVASNPAPLFAYVHFLEMHMPYVPKAQRGSREHEQMIRDYMDRCYVVACDPVRDATLIAKARGAYEAMLPEVDAAVGRVLEIARGRRRPFRLVITADHGELFGENGGFAHGGGFVPELLHIPFIVFDSRNPVPFPRCELLLSSEATRAAVTGAAVPDREELLLDILLGKAWIAKAGSLRYELSPAVVPHAGTWRNVHKGSSGTLPYPIASCQ